MFALPKLRKINLSGSGLVNINVNLWLLHLCKNCEFLEEVVMLNGWLSQDCIASSIRHRPTLRSLSFRSNFYSNIISLRFIDSLVSLKGLTCLDLSTQKISDELLSSIATGDLPLRRLALQHCKGYSYIGVFSLLSKCQRIQHLNLRHASFLYDHHIVKLSVFLADLVSIDLSQCRRLTVSALFALVRKCPSLTNARMEKTSIGKIIKKYNSLINFVLNPELKYLYLAHSSLLKDESLIMFASSLPNLQQLDLSNCDYISEEGICQVLRRCCKIRHLNLTKCNVVKLNILNFEVPKLEVLNLSYTRVGDEVLYTISKNCRGLLQFLLKGCNYVTKHGVKHVVENCTQLRVIDLEYCHRVCADIVDNMVHSRPSLRKIIAPPR
jgi:F-box/leucine-rich repeat protein 2/20